MGSPLSLSCVLAITCIGSLAWACPDLAGTYICNVGGQTSQLFVTQTKAEGVTTFITRGPVAAIEYVADNQVKQNVTEDAFSKNMRTSRAYCEELALRVFERSDFYRKPDDAIIGYSKTELKIGRTPNGQLLYSGKWESVYGDSINSGPMDIVCDLQASVGQ